MTVASDVSFEQSRPGGPLDFPALEMLLIRARDPRIHSYSSFRMPVLKGLLLQFNASRPPLLCDIAATLANCKVLKHLTLDILERASLTLPYPIIDLL